MILLESNKRKIVKLQQGGKAAKSQEQPTPFVDINITTAANKPVIGNVGKIGDIKFSYQTPKAAYNAKNEKELKAVKGFISDRQYVTEKVNEIRTRISRGLSEGKSYTSSGRRASDLLELKKALSDLYAAGQLEKDFNKAVKQNKIDTGAWMIYDNKALAFDTETNKLRLIPEDNIFEEDQNGNRKYKVQTVGNAIRFRQNFKQFSGFTVPGRLLTNMITHVLDEDEVFKRIDSGFKNGGFQAGAGFELITPNNSTANAKEVMDILHSGNKEEILKKNENTNAKAINAMRQIVGAQLQSDYDFGTAFRTKAMQIANATIPGLGRMTQDDRKAAIQTIERNIIDNEATKYLKTKYSTAFTALAKEAADNSKLEQNSVQQSLGAKAPRTSMDFDSIRFGKKFEVQVETISVPNGDVLLHHVFDSKQKLELDNLSDLSALSADKDLNRAVITRGNVPISSLTNNGLHDVVALPTEGIRVVRPLPMENVGGKGWRISEETLHLMEVYKDAKDLETKRAWDIICKHNKEACDKYEHTFENLNNVKTSDGASVALKISDKLKTSKALTAITNYVRSVGVKFKAVAEFKVAVKLDNGMFNFLKSGETPSAIPEEHAGYYTKIPDESFEHWAGKDNKVGSRYDAYATTVYMPLANFSSLSDLNMKTSKLTSNQLHKLAQKDAIVKANESPKTNGEVFKLIEE